jgi:hypothetical protein
MAKLRVARRFGMGTTYAADEGVDRDTERLLPEDPWPGGFEPVHPVDVAAPVAARLSVWAALGALVSVVGLGAAVVGLLAPVGFAAGIVGIVISLIGIRAATPAHVAGRGLAICGLFSGIAAVVVATLAMTGRFTWPNSSVDQTARWHTWLVARLPWLGRWS